MAEKAKNYTVGVPAAWQQQQEKPRSTCRGQIQRRSSEFSGTGQWTARRPAGAHSLWARFTTITLTAAAWFTGGPRSWQASSSLSQAVHRPGRRESDFESTCCKGVHGVQCHASGNDCIQTRTNIRGINCYVPKLIIHVEEGIYQAQTQQKAHLLQLASENDLSRKFKDEWKEMLLRRFHSSGKKKLQLYWR